MNKNKKETYITSILKHKNISITNNTLSKIEAAARSNPIDHTKKMITFTRTVLNNQRK